MFAYHPRKMSQKRLAGAPDNVIAVYDNSGRTADRYTVIYYAWRRDHRGCIVHTALAMSAQPYHPQGFGQSIECMRSLIGNGGNRPINFKDLPADCQKLAKERSIDD